MIVNSVQGKSPRWYDKEGNAVYEVIGKNGKPKAPTIREAKEQNFYPSVTTIIGQISKPGLEKWKISQAIISALTLPRNEGELDQDFAERVARDSQEEGKAAALKGTDIHSALETYIKTNVVPSGAENLCLSYNNFMEQFKVRLGSLQTEFKATNTELGYGGRGDLAFWDEISMSPIVVDFKSQDIGKKANFYDDWGMQIAAYGTAIYDLPFRGFSLVFDRTTGAAESKEWTDLDTDMDKFLCLLKYFQLEKRL